MVNVNIQQHSIMRPILPPELERYIFELTARDPKSDQQIFNRLMLVASRVHTWLEPLQFELLYLVGKTSVSNLIRTLSTKPPGFAVRYIKAIIVEASPTSRSALSSAIVTTSIPSQS